MKRHWKTAVNAVCYVLLGLLVCLAVLLFIGKMNHRVTFIGNRTAIWILSGSMEDAIPAKSYVLIRKVDPSEVKEGDVITFYSDDPVIRGSLNTHRVVEIVGDHEEFITRGDNNQVNDAYSAKAEKLVGVYERKLPVLTAVGRIFLSPSGMIAAILLLVLLTAVLYVPDILKSAKKRAEEPSPRTSGKKNLDDCEELTDVSQDETEKRD